MTGEAPPQPPLPIWEQVLFFELRDKYHLFRWAPAPLWGSDLEEGLRPYFSAQQTLPKDSNNHPIIPFFFLTWMVIFRTSSDTCSMRF